MPAERYFLDATFQVDEPYELTAAEFHHLSHVMRDKVGDTIELINGKGCLATGVITRITKDKAIVIIEKFTQEEPIKPKLILAQAIPKQNRLETIIEKGTELGVDEFWLFPGSSSLKKNLFPQQIERMLAITIAAIKQCGRLFLPTIHVLPSLEQWEKFSSLSFFGDLSAQATPFHQAAKEMHKMQYPIIFITGPESGFSTAEVDTLYRLGSIGVILHHNTLRTDTAAIAGLSILNYLYFLT